MKNTFKLDSLEEGDLKLTCSEVSNEKDVMEWGCIPSIQRPFAFSFCFLRWLLEQFIFKFLCNISWTALVTVACLFLSLFLSVSEAQLGWEWVTVPQKELPEQLCAVLPVATPTGPAHFWFSSIKSVPISASQAPNSHFPSVPSPPWSPVGNKWDVCTFLRVVLGRVYNGSGFERWADEQQKLLWGHKKCCARSGFIWKSEQTKLCLVGLLPQGQHLLVFFHLCVFS